MTDTELFTASENTDGNQPSNAVTTDTPDVKTNAPAGALSTMVLPELRALANQVGVKGTSGMRKNELIAAIHEIRGQANGASTPAAPEARLVVLDGCGHWPQFEQPREFNDAVLPFLAGPPGYPPASRPVSGAGRAESADR